MPYTLTDDDKRKLALTLLGEAEGAGTRGMTVVANVIKNRAESGSGLWPDDPVSVALQSGQFSTWNDASNGGNQAAVQARVAADPTYYNRALDIVEQVFVDGTAADNTGGSFYYHNADITPYWADNVQTAYGTERVGPFTVYPTHPVPPMNIPEVGSELDTSPENVALPRPRPTPPTTALAIAKFGAGPLTMSAPLAPPEPLTPLPIPPLTVIDSRATASSRDFGPVGATPHLDANGNVTLQGIIDEKVLAEAQRQAEKGLDGYLFGDIVSRETSPPASGAPPRYTLDWAPPPGMVEKGNLDLDNRPIHFFNDGTYGSELSFSIGTDKGETLIPQIVNGKLLTRDEAIRHYQQTGENLGTFNSPEAADAYAQRVHERDQGLADMPVPRTFPLATTFGGRLPADAMNGVDRLRADGKPLNLAGLTPNWRQDSLGAPLDEQVSALLAPQRAVSAGAATLAGDGQTAAGAPSPSISGGLSTRTVHTIPIGPDGNPAVPINRETGTPIYYSPLWDSGFGSEPVVVPDAPAPAPLVSGLLRGERSTWAPIIPPTVAMPIKAETVTMHRTGAPSATDQAGTVAMPPGARPAVADQLVGRAVSETKKTKAPSWMGDDVGPGLPPSSSLDWAHSDNVGSGPSAAGLRELQQASLNSGMTGRSIAPQPLSVANAPTYSTITTAAERTITVLNPAYTTYLAMSQAASASADAQDARMIRDAALMGGSASAPPAAPPGPPPPKYITKTVVVHSTVKVRRSGGYAPMPEPAPKPETVKIATGKELPVGAKFTQVTNGKTYTYEVQKDGSIKNNTTGHVSSPATDGSAGYRLDPAGSGRLVPA